MSGTSPQDRPPLLFDEFFSLGSSETKSPFLKPKAREWSHNLQLKASLLAASLLFVAFFFSFFEEKRPLSHLFLLFVYFLAGVPSLIDALEDLIGFEVNIDVLMTVAAFSSILIDSAMEGGLLLVLFSLSHALEELVSEKAKGAINKLKRLSPTKALVADGEGLFIERALRDIAVGDLLLIKAGEIIPLDGRIVKGSSLVDLSHLTGEQLPALKREGDLAPAGGQAIDGSLVLEVIHAVRDSALAKIIDLVIKAQEAKPKLQRWFDRLSERYAVGIISLSLLIALLFPPLFAIDYLGKEGSIYRALAFLIAASPCALIIALPIAYLSAISACAREGIILKGGLILDALAECGKIAFDKTGTLTTGKVECEGYQPIGKGTGLSEMEILSIALSLESNAHHPIAEAIVLYAGSKGAHLVEIDGIKLHPGLGIEGRVLLRGEETFALFGRWELISPHLSAERREDGLILFEKMKREAKSLSFFLLGKDLFLFSFRDRLRYEVVRMVKELKALRHLELLILTGDHRASALAVADMVGIDRVYADLLPEDKLRLVHEFSQVGGLAMVGDGINDAPALARAKVGISLGNIGSSVAVEAADVVLLQDDLSRLPWLIEKARFTKRIVRENLIIALIAIPLAAIPALFGLIPLWLAVICHEGGTILVGCNALRLLR